MYSWKQIPLKIGRDHSTKMCCCVKQDRDPKIDLGKDLDRDSWNGRDQRRDRGTKNDRTSKTNRNNQTARRIVDLKSPASARPWQLTASKPIVEHAKIAGTIASAINMIATSRQIARLNQIVCPRVLMGPNMSPRPKGIRTTRVPKNRIQGSRASRKALITT